MKVDLPSDVWAAVHGMLLDCPMPLRVSLPIVQKFERALKDAREIARGDEQPE